MRKTFSLALALSISLFVYLFYRSERTVVNELMVLILTLDTYAALKNSIANSIPLNAHIVFSLPGGLWIFCASVHSQDFYMQVRTYKLQLAFVPVFFAIGLELCQLLHLTNGRFDALDIGFYFLFWFLAYYYFPSKTSQQNILSPFTVRGFICVACFLSVYLAHVNQ